MRTTTLSKPTVPPSDALALYDACLRLFRSLLSLDSRDVVIREYQTLVLWGEGRRDQLGVAIEKSERLRKVTLRSLCSILRALRSLMRIMRNEQTTSSLTDTDFEESDESDEDTSDSSSDDTDAGVEDPFSFRTSRLSSVKEGGTRARSDVDTPDPRKGKEPFNAVETERTEISQGSSASASLKNPDRDDTTSMLIFDSDFAEKLDDLRVYVQGLVDLGSTIEQPADHNKDSRQISERHLSKSLSSLLEPAAYTGQIQVRFPKIRAELATELGVLNYIRFVRLQLRRQTNRGTSVTSEGVYTPSITSTSPGGSAVRVPPLPSEELNCKSIGCCIACGMSVNVKDRRQWKEHVFHDLRPYVCLVPGCQLETFNDRSSFGSHLVTYHANDPLVTQQQCPICHKTAFTSQPCFLLHVARHMEEIALAALPSGVESDSLVEDNVSTDDEHELARAVTTDLENNNTKDKRSRPPRHRSLSSIEIGSRRFRTLRKHPPDDRTRSKSKTRTRPLMAETASAEDPALHTELVHMLAPQPMEMREITRRMKVSEEEIRPTLAKVAREQKGKWKLADRAYKELDPFSPSVRFPTEEERKKAIDRAVGALDRQRLDPRDEIWQKLLPEAERGKGKTLSRLTRGAFAAVAFPGVLPKRPQG
ncbi:transcription factor c2h2 [Diplodia corticola]|uniref:Transcription factor c2h2 n=1 Tax=Diplodia corticola TaxID=236234 RepID=A0A1J9QVS7_9PEZI|nr:transcription factor c2h2 [Diplodia corticola]OJD33094.1 transcription factor c2h2 [Diplodia corticola]